MKKSIAFFLALLITFLIANNYYLFSAFTIQNDRETAVISRVIDGDTLDLKDGRKIRLLNINSPEKNTFGYSLSYEFLKKYENKSVEINIIDTDKYNRYLARIYSKESYLNLDLVSLGFASKFLVQDQELKDFSKAEQKAIHNSFKYLLKRYKIK